MMEWCHINSLRLAVVLPLLQVVTVVEAGGLEEPESSLTPAKDEGKPVEMLLLCAAVRLCEHRAVALLLTAAPLLCYTAGECF